MKARRFMMLSAVLMMTLCGCSDQKVSAKNSEDFFKSLKCYEATATVSFLKDDQKNTIEMKQNANIAGNYEMVYLSPQHLQGTTLSYDGEKLIESFPNHEMKIEEKPGKAQNEVLVTSFAKRLMENGNAKKENATLEGKKVVTYEMPIEGNYKYLAKEKIWVDQESLIPIQLEIYDTEGNVSIQVKYDQFKYNS